MKNIIVKFKRLLFTAGVALLLALGITAISSAPAQAISTNTTYHNGRGTRNILINTSATSKYALSLRPGESYLMYGSVKYGWVPSGCELQHRYAGSWHVIGNAKGRTGFWIKLPAPLYANLGTYCP